MAQEKIKTRHRPGQPEQRFVVASLRFLLFPLSEIAAYLGVSEQAVSHLVTHPETQQHLKTLQSMLSASITQSYSDSIFRDSQSKFQFGTLARDVVESCSKTERKKRLDQDTPWIPPIPALEPPSLPPVDPAPYRK